LKSYCEDYLIATITTETAVHVLFVAVLHQASRLKAKMLDFITDNFAEVKLSEGWKELATKPELLIELLTIATAKK